MGKPIFAPRYLDRMEAHLQTVGPTEAECQVALNLASQRASLLPPPPNLKVNIS